MSRREWLAACTASLRATGRSGDYPQRIQDVSRDFEAADGITVTQITD